MPKDNRHIVEIGPGLGDLTKKLLQQCEGVTAFEIDLELCGYLQETFADEIAKKQLALICNDVLEQWSDNSLINEPYHLVANLPYYIATNLILKALDDKSCHTIIVMIQKEVAEKFAAKAEEKNYSSLAILADSISKAEILFDVGPECFDPPPKVTSAVLKLTKFTNYVTTDGQKALFEDENELHQFKRFLRDAFSAPRKTLLKNLQNSTAKEQLVTYFEDLQIAQNIRPHQLPSQQYHLLFHKIYY